MNFRNRLRIPASPLSTLLYQPFTLISSPFVSLTLSFPLLPFQLASHPFGFNLAHVLPTYSVAFVLLDTTSCRPSAFMFGLRRPPSDLRLYFHPRRRSLLLPAPFLRPFGFRFETQSRFATPHGALSAIFCVVLSYLPLRQKAVTTPGASAAGVSPAVGRTRQPSRSPLAPLPSSLPPPPPLPSLLPRLTSSRVSLPPSSSPGQCCSSAARIRGAVRASREPQSLTCPGVSSDGEPLQFLPLLLFLPFGAVCV